MSKVAFPTDDGETISRHLGQAQYYVVIDIEEHPSQFERRSKPVHDAHDETGGDHQHNGHGLAQTMFEPLADCQVLISGGMGQPAYQFALSRGLQVILTGEKTIAGALQAYQSGTLASDMRRVHRAH